MGVLGGVRLSYAFLFFVIGFSVQARDFYRIFYSDKPLNQQDHDFLRQLYGSELYVVPSFAKPPKLPKHLQGIVLHNDDDDILWVKGDENPAFEMPDFLSDKWNETQFLLRYAPELAPQAVLASVFLKGPSKKEALEAIRRRIEREMGPSILKTRNGYGSDGHLPKTTDPWAVIFESYLKDTKPKIEELNRQGLVENLHETIMELPFSEALVLEELLNNPGDVLIQKLIDIEKEVRLHIVRGKILKGGTFLRFSPLGVYLSEPEIERIEEAITRFLLSRLPAEYRNLSCGMDVAMEKKTGKLFIIDLNIGNYSGFFFPEYELFTTQLIAEYFSGHETPFLKQFREFEKAPFEEKYLKLRPLVATYGAYVASTETMGLWDRAARAYIRDLSENPTPERFDQILSQLSQLGLQDVQLYHQICAEIQDRFPNLRLAPSRLWYWVRFLSEQDTDIVTYTEGNRLRGDDSCAEILALAS